MTRRLIPYSSAFRWIAAGAAVGAAALSALASNGAGSEPANETSATLYFFLIALGCLAFSALFSGSETAFLSANLPKLEAEAELGDPSARKAASLYEPKERTQATILIGNNLVNAGAGVCSYVVAGSLLTEYSTEQLDIVNTFVVGSLLLVFGEILPKSLARAYPDRIMRRIAPVLGAFDWAFRPINFVILGAATAFMRLTGQTGQPEIVTREDLRILAETGEEDGALEEDQRKMIHGVLETYEQRVERVMRPLADFVSIKEGSSVGELMEKVSESGYSRLPVYSERAYDIVGIVYILDVIYDDAGAETIDPFIRRKPLFVPETKLVSTLLAELRRQRRSMAFAVDERGNVVGLVTMEDLVEEIFGEIRDERDDEHDIYHLNERTGVIECGGETELSLLKDAAAIPEGNYETIGGFLMHWLDKIPEKSDVVETDDLMVIVLEADERSVRRVRIAPKSSRPDTSSNGEKS